MLVNQRPGFFVNVLIEFTKRKHGIVFKWLISLLLIVFVI